MLSSLLVLLSDAKQAYRAPDLARRWASSHEALCVGLSVLVVEKQNFDKPTARADLLECEQWEQPLWDDAKSRLGQVRDQFRRLCTQANVVSQVLNETGRPADVIAREAQRCDLVLVDYPRTPPSLGGLSESDLVEVVKQCPRPLVVVPDHPTSESDVVIAYDGSLQAARTVQAFAHTGLAADRQVRVVGIAEKDATVAQPVDRAVDFLHRHHIAAHAVPMTSEDDPSSALLEHISVHPTGLLIMGTFGKNLLRDPLFGSVTQRVLNHCPVPIFLYH